MACVSDHYEIKISVVFVPSVILASEFPPDGFGFGFPLFGVLPIEGVQIVEYSRCIDDEIVLTVVNQYFDVSVQ